MSSSARDQPITIAVIDDDPAILDSIGLSLEFQNWNVRTYLSGEEFLADLDNRTLPDCIILDPHLTGMSGSEVVQSTKNGRPAVPIIGLTARPTSQVTKAVIDAGVLTILTKPVSEEQLIFYIRRELRRRSLH